VNKDTSSRQRAQLAQLPAGSAHRARVFGDGHPVRRRGPRAGSIQIAKRLPTMQYSGRSSVSCYAGLVNDTYFHHRVPRSRNDLYTRCREGPPITRPSSRQPPMAASHVYNVSAAARTSLNSDQRSQRQEMDHQRDGVFGFGRGRQRNGVLRGRVGWIGTIKSPATIRQSQQSRVLRNRARAICPGSVKHEASGIVRARRHHLGASFQSYKY